MKVKSASEVAQSCLTLSNPMDCSLPGSSVHGRRSIFISSVHFLDKSTGVGCHCLLHLPSSRAHLEFLDRGGEAGAAPSMGQDYSDWFNGGHVT